MAGAIVERPQLYRVSWGALFAGFFFGFGAWALLLTLGAGIELLKFDPRELGNLRGIGLGMGIWSLVSGIISLFFAGWMSGRLSASTERLQGLLHGVALWGLMLVAGLWMATTTVAKVAAGAAAGAAGGASEERMQRPDLQPQALQSPQEPLLGDPQATQEQAAKQAAVGGATGAWAFFVFGTLTLAASAIGGAIGVPRERRRIEAREEPAPVAADRPPSPQRA